MPKNRNGEFSRSFSSIEWGNGYTEGNSWHHSFPPYAIAYEGATAVTGSGGNLRYAAVSLCVLCCGFELTVTVTAGAATRAPTPMEDW